MQLLYYFYNFCKFDQNNYYMYLSAQVCNTVNERQCTTINEEVCETQYQPQYTEQCSTTYEEECTTTYEQVKNFRDQSKPLRKLCVINFDKINSLE